MLLTRESGRLTVATADIVGGCLAAGLVGWSVVSANASDGGLQTARGVVATVAAAAGAFIASRLVSPRARWLSPAVVVVVASIVAVVTWGSSATPGERLMAYSNARADLYVQGFAAALMLAAVGRRLSWRFAGIVAAAVLTVITISTGSLAADLLLGLPLAAAAVGATGSSQRPFLAALAVLLVLSPATTVALGIVAPGSGRDDASTNAVIEITLTGRRTALWHDALALMADEPLLGVGPGRFRFESPTARSDRDAAWAHNGFLQMGAETGIVGAVLLLGLFLWAILRAWNRPPDTAALVGASAVCALGIHACIDYVLHFPVLPVVAAAILGSAVTRAAHEGSHPR